MPRYHFDVTDAGRPARDHFGIDLAGGDDEARTEVISLLAALFRDILPDSDQHEIRVSARSEAGPVVYEASLSLSGRWRPERRTDAGRPAPV